MKGQAVVASDRQHHKGLAGDSGYLGWGLGSDTSLAGNQKQLSCERLTGDLIPFADRKRESWRDMVRARLLKSGREVRVGQQLG